MTLEDLYEQATQYTRKPATVKAIQMDDVFKIETMNGVMQGNKGDWVVIDEDTELILVCGDVVFKKFYTEFKHG